MTEKVLLKNAETPDSHGIGAYEASGGYQALATVLRDYQPDELIELVKDSGLKGRGGAGFATGVKWSFVPKDPALKKYLCCNADEGEPGTFKDRAIMEKDPHQMIEGMILCAYAIGA
ncbi:MAG: NADH-quinone oxidoreductase subunit F, partial [Alphaproteobacteria bacterium]|nr:NADH-quinone oxidoreductase subunit F [Alphaproteobacteria bacterium]